jgi:hypothetical protein
MRSVVVFEHLTLDRVLAGQAAESPAGLKERRDAISPGAAR